MVLVDVDKEPGGQLISVRWKYKYWHFSTVFLPLSSIEREAYIILLYPTILSKFGSLINPAAAAWQIKFHHHPDSFAQLIL